MSSSEWTEFWRRTLCCRLEHGAAYLDLRRTGLQLEIRSRTLI
jgi:hypothetical protein